MPALPQRKLGVRKQPLLIHVRNAAVGAQIIAQLPKPVLRNRSGRQQASVALGKVAATALFARAPLAIRSFQSGVADSPRKRLRQRRKTGGGHTGIAHAFPVIARWSRKHDGILQGVLFAFLYMLS